MKTDSVLRILCLQSVQPSLNNTAYLTIVVGDLESPLRDIPLKSIHRILVLFWEILHDVSPYVVAIVVV